MSKLIDVDMLIKKIDRYTRTNNVEFNIACKYIIEVVKEQPTAFDVEKVVSELETQSEMNLKKGLIEVLPDEARPYLKAVESYDKAIEIVKRGGIDENKKDN